MYECIRTLTAIHPSPPLVAGAAEAVGRLLGAREANLRYAGVDALARLVDLDPQHAQVRLLCRSRSSAASLAAHGLRLSFATLHPRPA